MEPQVHLGWRRALSVVVASAAGVAAVAVYLALDGVAAGVTAAAGAAVALIFGRRVVWPEDRWRRHLAARRAEDRELRRADEGGRTRPPF